MYRRIGTIALFAAALMANSPYSDTMPGLDLGYTRPRNKKDFKGNKRKRSNRLRFSHKAKLKRRLN